MISGTGQKKVPRSKPDRAFDLLRGGDGNGNVIPDLRRGELSRLFVFVTEQIENLVLAEAGHQLLGAEAVAGGVFMIEFEGDNRP